MFQAGRSFVKLSPGRVRNEKRGMKREGVVLMVVDDILLQTIAIEQRNSH